MIYPRTQKGNPHSLTLNGHVFPAASLFRFADGGGVWVKRFGWHEPKKLSPGNPIFCGHRAWDQRSETGQMLRIEERFQALANRIVGGYGALSEAECNAVTEFYALWRHRAIERQARQPDITFGRGAPADNLTHDQRECVEKNGYIVFNGRGALPGRMAAGIRIQMGIRRVALELHGAQWGVGVAREGEFVVPDHFGWAPIVPVSPSICLFAAMGDHTVLLDGVRDINRVAARMAFSTSNGYVIARDFSKCPV